MRSSVEALDGAGAGLEPFGAEERSPRIIPSFRYSRRKPLCRQSRMRDETEVFGQSD
jgi:hypothetical protein